MKRFKLTLEIAFVVAALSAIATFSVCAAFLIVDSAKIAWSYDPFQVLQLKDGKYGFYSNFNELTTFDTCEDAEKAAKRAAEWNKIFKAKQLAERKKKSWNPIANLDLKFVKAEPVECGGGK